METAGDQINYFVFKQTAFKVLPVRTLATLATPTRDPNVCNRLMKKMIKLPYPKSVFFIVSNEFCERFSFYGMRTILSLYLKNQLKFSTDTATSIYHVFIMICYFFPLLGAIVADSWLGKYKTILYLSVVYAIGNVVVSTAAIPDTLPPQAFTMVGLVLIALGTGGIKPCVSAFGGDQFILPNQKDQLQKFFSLFYFAINSGSFISTFLTPLLREYQCFGQDSCYSLAFGVPALLMIVAILIYIGGKRFYKIKDPEGNVVVKVAACTWYAIKKKSSSTYEHWLDKAQDKYDKGFIDDIKATLKVLFLYIPLPIFWALFDQQGSRWTFQASRMSGEIGSFKLQPDQMQVVNPVLILAFIPLFQTVLYPLLAKCNLLTRPLQKLTVGGLLAAASFGISAGIELMLEPTYAVLPQPNQGQIRLYNAFPGDLSLEIPELTKEKIVISSLNVWEKLDIPVSKQTSFKVTYKYETKSKETNITVYEEKATSFTFMEDMIIEKKDENIEKAEKGKPKVMILFSDTEKYDKKDIVLYDTGNEKTVTFTVTKAEPYVNFTEVDLNVGKYEFKVDGKIAIGGLEFKQGGVYTIIILKNGNELKGNNLVTTQPNTVHMLWLIPQYVIMTAGEVMFSITGLEFSYSQAPSTMKSLIQAAWLLTVAIGNLVVVIVAESKIFTRQMYEFLLFAGLMFLDMIIFALMAMRYTYVEDLVDENKTEMEEVEKKNEKEKF